MKIIKVWDIIKDVFGNTILHPQFFMIRGEVQSVEKTLPKLKGKVLDIGCGRQLLKKSVQEAGCEYIGLDHPTVSKRQRSIIAPDILADIESIPLRNGSIDSILLFMVIEHAPHPLSALKEINRILKKGGRIFMNTTENYPGHDLPSDYFRFRMSGLISLFNETGFRVTQKFSWGNIFQSNALNLNVLILQEIKGLSIELGMPLTLVILTAVYPLMLIFNLLAYILSPLDFKHSLRIGNFLIAEKT